MTSSADAAQESDLRTSLATRIEDQTGVQIDPEEHVTVENGRARLTDTGAEHLDVETRDESRLPDLSIPWDRISSWINSRLPPWARWEGYATYAVACYVYAGVAGAFSAGFLYAGASTLGGLVGLVGLVLLVIGNYYRSAAKLRVECGHCGAAAKGQDRCPECGELTYTGGQA